MNVPYYSVFAICIIDPTFSVPLSGSLRVTSRNYIVFNKPRCPLFWAAVLGVDTVISIVCYQNSRLSGTEETPRKWDKLASYGWFTNKGAGVGL